MTEKLHNNIISGIVERDLCSGCGVCAGICPGKHLVIDYAPNGDLAAKWRDEPCGVDCGLCLKVCPFREGIYDPRELNKSFFGAENGAYRRLFHEDAGYYDCAYVGYSPIHRPSSASGGLLTWTLESLLEKGEIDRAAVVTCESDVESGYCFSFKEAHTADEVRMGSGSVYHQVEISGLLSRIALNPELRWAITGVPCMCSALRSAMLSLPQIGKSIRYLLGLACGMYQNKFYTEMLLKESGMDCREVIKVEYRRKSDGGPTSNFLFRGTGIQGPGKEVPYRGLPLFLGKNAFFRLNACNFCMDVFSEAADACFMDAWLPDYRKDSRGTSLVVIRNSAIRTIIEKGKKENSIIVDIADIQDVVSSQHGHVCRKRYMIGLRCGEKIDKTTGKPFCFGDRLSSQIQNISQRRSKESWVKVRNGKGLSAFWRETWDVLCIVKILDLYNNFFGRTARFMNGLRGRIFK